MWQCVAVGVSGPEAWPMLQVVASVANVAERNEELRGSSSRE
ncbi:hypothetical protein [Sporisorium scitamineum]|uniref:Uncharacterized protein n=1 Tax=Sporisorium scitamineum TaxID=49012 RepID=A0A0F7S0S1_9BASI|nr:hypothetical protein [Sporisorium scitamineum]